MPTILKQTRIILNAILQPFLEAKCFKAKHNSKKHARKRQLRETVQWANDTFENYSLK